MLIVCAGRGVTGHLSLPRPENAVGKAWSAAEDRTAQQTSVWPAAWSSQWKRRPPVQCTCLAPRETHAAENVHCLTEPEQKLPQGTPSTRVQSSREKLDWKKSCVSSSLTGFSSSGLSLALWCSVTTSPIPFYYTYNTMSPRLSVSGTVSPYL